MRKYPKRCPKCKEDMEPIFVEGLERSTSSNPLTLSNEIDPIYWKCMYCGYKTEKEDV